MTSKQRKVVKTCLIILTISMAVMAISTIINVIHNGWEAFSVVNIVPFIGMAGVMVSILTSDKNEDDK